MDQFANMKIAFRPVDLQTRRQTLHILTHLRGINLFVSHAGNVDGWREVRLNMGQFIDEMAYNARPSPHADDTLDQVVPSCD